MFIIQRQTIAFYSTYAIPTITSIIVSGKGGKNRRRGKGDGEESKRELEFKEEGQEYAQVVKMLGNGRCDCFCFDGVSRLGHIRGKMRKKVWVTAGDISSIILKAKEDKYPSVTFTLVPPEHLKIRPDDNMPQIHFEQLNAVTYQHSATINNTKASLFF